MSSKPFPFSQAPDEDLSSGAVSALPVHLWMPPDGIPFDEARYIATPAVGNLGAVVQFTVPEGYHGVIRKIGNVYIGAGFVEGSGSLIWQILQNGEVVRNYDNIVASLGTVTQPGEIPGAIIVFEQQVITLQVSNVSLLVGGTQVGGRLSGWYFPKEYFSDQSAIGS
jgi:hypothetical protein